MSQHYRQRQRESIELIKESLSEEQFKGFLVGNVYKYLNRYEYKSDPQGDLYKAATYIYALIRVLDNPKVSNPFQEELQHQPLTNVPSWGVCPNCGDGLDTGLRDSA